MITFNYPEPLMKGIRALVSAAGLMMQQEGVAASQVQKVQNHLGALVEMQDPSSQPKELQEQHASLHRALTQSQFSSHSPYFVTNPVFIRNLIFRGQKDMLLELVKRIDLKFTKQNLGEAISSGNSELLEILYQNLSSNQSLEGTVIIDSRDRGSLSQLAVGKLDLTALNFLKDKVNLSAEFGCNKIFLSMQDPGPDSNTFDKLARAIDAHITEVDEQNYQATLEKILGVLGFMKDYNLSINAVLLDFLLVQGLHDANNESQTRIIQDILQGAEKQGLRVEYSAMGTSVDNSPACRYLKTLLVSDGEDLHKSNSTKIELLRFIRSKVAVPV